jgi:hypothetical protein
MEMSPFALVSMAWQHEDETLDPVEADRFSEDMRVRCGGPASVVEPRTVPRRMG